MFRNLTPHAANAVGLRTGMLKVFCILLLAAGIATPRPMAAEKGKPLSARDVTDLLDGSVPSAEIARVVGENGISFHLTDDLENQFRQDGATDELINAIRKADHAQAPTLCTAHRHSEDSIAARRSTSLYQRRTKGRDEPGRRSSLARLCTRHLSLAGGAGGI